LAESENLAARVMALETVIRQLVTHFAVRSDDPPGWVRTRKVLALSAVGTADPTHDGLHHRSFGDDRVREAISDLFDDVEQIAANYALSDPRGTRRAMPR